MSCGSEFAPELRSRGYRVTAQRMAVLHVLRHSQSHLSPAEVYQRARRKVPGLTETTVYRTLDFLSRNGLAWPLQLHKGHLVYELAGNRHHHLICRQCGDQLEVDQTFLQSMYQRLETASGYRLSDDHVTLFGICPACQTANTGKAG